MQVEGLRPFGKIMNLNHREDLNDVSGGELVALASRHKLLVIRGGQRQDDFDLVHFGRRLHAGLPGEEAELVVWPFGPLMTLQFDASSPNYLFSDEKVPYHWDGAFHVEPRFLVFHCIDAPTGAGGETFFCNTELVIAKADEGELAQWQNITLTYTTEKLAHYGGQVCRPLLASHPFSGQTILRYAEPVVSKKNPVTVSSSGLPEKALGAIQQRIGSLLYHDKFRYTHVWQTGDILIADNFSLLHGRNAYQPTAPRHLCRVQVR